MHGRGTLLGNQFVWQGFIGNFLYSIIKIIQVYNQRSIKKKKKKATH